MRPKFAFKRPQIHFSRGVAETKAPRTYYEAPKVKQIWHSPDVNLHAPKAQVKARGPKPDLGVYGPEADLGVYAPKTSYRRSSPTAYVVPKQSYGKRHSYGGYSDKKW